jgi:Ca2+-binding RTX toxin-like protein
LPNNVENLSLTGTANASATGNALANTLIGNSGNNYLEGGMGADTLTGGGNADTFALGLTDRAADVTTDFLSGTDHLQISDNASVRIGDGDHAVDNAIAVNTAHAFTTPAELTA